MCSPCHPPHSSGHFSPFRVVPATLPIPLVTSVLCGKSLAPSPVLWSPQFSVCSPCPPPHSPDHLPSSIPKWAPVRPIRGPFGAQPCPTGAQPGPTWNAAWAQTFVGSPCHPPHSSGHLSSLCVVPALLPTPLITSQAAFPNGPQSGPSGAHLGPNLAQLGPNRGPHGMLLGLRPLWVVPAPLPTPLVTSVLCG